MNTILDPCVVVMVVCQLCGREFKNERGLSIHLARTHDVRGPRGRLSLKVINHFFPFLNNRKWTEGNSFLTVLKDSEDGWRKGYAHALRGMVAALKQGYSSPQPYILKLKSCTERQLREVVKQFSGQSKIPINTEFDQGYFQAWRDYIHYRLQKV
jgi:hypothetical protein